MQVLFQWELQGVLARTHDTEPEFINHIDLLAVLGNFLGSFYPRDQAQLDMPFIIEVVKGTISSIVHIDRLLDKASTKWKLSRMDAIDRAILRIACFELQVKREISPRVVINEAVELAKRYGSEQSPSFINGILDALREN